MKPLTAIQKATLDFIRAYIGENGAPPTNAELAAGMGWASANNAQLHLKALQRKGCLQIRKGISRGIVLCDIIPVDIPDTAAEEYWVDGIFQHLRYERDVYKVIEAAGLKSSKKSWGGNND
ncbi:LexA family transcriptional regulator [Pantoea agglomerans]|uniref:LexA family protein n=1 Tax=Enterobacter agglomerans TaxID=549 RepID=UPI0013B7A57E|nr:LexA family transcriptional regulator [Pantoea agglomerans]NEG58228.1 LexA family transcriptional regulator [Pantoea agglomerans]NEG99941.1 LexA family transcriptional regulator [Pantoea agglomerans]NEH04096.1 LexA family transcriptional regulator [Pantoea agglomerans]NEH14501.1 LexA family transcriptional regulator [Pantoea agglomerans]